MERQPTELTESWLESSDVSRQSSEAQAEVPLVPSPERRGRDAAIKRADAPSKSSNKKRSRRGEGFSLVVLLVLVLVLNKHPVQVSVHQQIGSI